MPKRTLEEKRKHLLEKIRKIDRRMLSVSDNEGNDKSEKENMIEDEFEEGEISTERDELCHQIYPEDELYDGFLEDENKEEMLEDEVLDILGVAPVPTPKKQDLQREIADRWTEILSKGMKKEEKENINIENPPFQNVKKMVAPKLNREVAAALNDNAKKRDILIESRQKQISTALVCIGQALQLSLGNIQEQRLNIIKKMNEAGRMLCDSLFLDSMGRRKLVLSVINKDLKESLIETECCEYLFGDNLTDKIKTAKAVQKSGKDLKITPTVDIKKTFVKRPENTTNKQTLNWRGPPRGGLQQRSQRLGGPTYNHFNRQVMKKTEDKTASRRGRK